MLDSDGFLELPTSEGSWFHAGAAPIPVTDLVGSSGGYVLLAPGGVGKTTVLNELKRLEPAAVAVDLGLFDKSGMHRALAEALDRGAPVYLDGLDVVAREEPAVFRIVEHYLAKPEAARVCWRLACRPAVWDVSLAASLRHSLPDFEELTLLPLSRVAAVSLVARVGAAGFLDAFTRADLGRLAASSMQFEAAARQWGATRTLPESHYAAVDYEVRQLLAEPNPQVRPTLPLDRRLRIAARLAAMSIFGRINRFAQTAQPVSAGRQYLGELPSTPEPDEPGNPVTLEQLEEVVGTALFDPAADGAVMFRHQQYAEFLAARYVIERGITRAQLRSLLGIQQSDRVPGALAGVTAWLAAMAPDLAEDLIAANPIVLTQTGVEIPSDDVRAAVVDALLATAARADIEPDWGLDLTGLTYSGLEDQLRRRLDDGLWQPEGVWWMSRLAEVGRCDGLADRLLAEALDTRWKPWARRQAAAAVASFNQDAVTVQLTALLSLEPTEDPADELLASGVEALYPRLMSTADLLEVLRPRRNTSLVGAYLVLLGELSERIPTPDLPTVLAWASERVKLGEQAYGRLIRHLVQSAGRIGTLHRYLRHSPALSWQSMRNTGSRGTATTRRRGWMRIPTAVASWPCSWPSNSTRTTCMRCGSLTC
jgi:hypothetical protein